VDERSPVSYDPQSKHTGLNRPFKYKALKMKILKINEYRLKVRKLDSVFSVYVKCDCLPVIHNLEAMKIIHAFSWQ
jgi:hypothetical protein